MTAKYPNHRDAQFWRLGFIYYNPLDRNLFVERRYSTGVTVNFAHRGALGILAAILLPPIAVITALLAIVR